MSSRSVLFVGQEDIADDLNHGFTSQQDAWEVAFAVSGDAALKALNTRPFDVVATELNLPDMPAIALLTRVQEQSPGIVRIVFSAGNDRELLLKSLAVAHQLVAKPCKLDALKSQLVNSLALRTILTNEKLHARIAAITRLPVLPNIYTQLVEEMQSETASIQKIAGLIRQDVATTAKVLQMINSAFFGLPTRVENPLQAVNLLGLDTIKSLVLTAGVFSQFRDPEIPGLSLDAIYEHSLAVGAGARNFANAFGLTRKHAEDALTAGMLHDIGKLILMANFQEELREIVRLMHAEKLTIFAAESRVLGVTHCEVGAHLLSLWGLSDQILEAVALHDSPNEAACPATNILAAVHLANAIDHDQKMVDRNPKFTHADCDYLNKIGLCAQLPYLRSLAVAR